MSTLLLIISTTLCYNPYCDPECDDLAKSQPLSAVPRPRSIDSTPCVFSAAPITLPRPFDSQGLRYLSGTPDHSSMPKRSTVAAAPKDPGSPTPSAKKGRKAAPKDADENSALVKGANVEEVLIESTKNAPPKKAPAKKAVTKTPAAKKEKDPATIKATGPIYEASMRPAANEAPAFRVASWNVAGLRALLKKLMTCTLYLVPCNMYFVSGNLYQEDNALLLVACGSYLDVAGLSALLTKVEEVEAQLGLPGWSITWNLATKAGYSGWAIALKQLLFLVNGTGTCTLSRKKGLEFEDMYVVNVYVPNAGAALARLEERTQSWDKDFAAYLKALQDKKPVVLVGDMNVAHQPIDIHSPTTITLYLSYTNHTSPALYNNHTSPLTPGPPGPEASSVGTDTSTAEKEANALLSPKLVDTFRKQHPDVIGYTELLHTAQHGGVYYRLIAAQLHVSPTAVPDILYVLV
eukprot:gene943-36023_t